MVAEQLQRPEAPSAAEPRLVISGVHKSYRRRVVLDGVDAAVAAGEVLAIVGPNGAGKPTLLRICAGLQVARRGHGDGVRRPGLLPAAARPGGPAARRRALRARRAGRGLDRVTARRQGAELARALDLLPDRRPVGDLSGGTRQKLNVVLAALGDPSVLLLDEPYQGFDGDLPRLLGAGVALARQRCRGRRRHPPARAAQARRPRAGARRRRCRAGSGRPAGAVVRRALVVARATAVALLRRRTVVVLMVVVPLAFYVARHGLTGQSIRFLAVGMAWALSTLAAFAVRPGHRPSAAPGRIPQWRAPGRPGPGPGRAGRPAGRRVRPRRAARPRPGPRRRGAARHGPDRGGRAAVRPARGGARPPSAGGRDAAAGGLGSADDPRPGRSGDPRAALLVGPRGAHVDGRRHRRRLPPARPAGTPRSPSWCSGARP